RFVAEHQEYSLLNERRGKGIFEFMLSHYMQESSQFTSFDRPLRTRVLGYAKTLESFYSIWESNKLGRVWTFPGANLPRNAYAFAHHRLVDAFFSINFAAANNFFDAYLNPLKKFPIQFLHNIIIDDPKTVLQEFVQMGRVKILPR